MYNFAVEQCDVTAERRRQLLRFREARQRWLDRLNGPSANAISTQLSSLMYFDTAYATLRAIRVVEAHRPVNELLWILYEFGYPCLIATGVRRLVDKHEKTGSLMSLVLAVEQVERNESLFTRENYVCNDGLPFDSQAVLSRFHQSIPADSTNFFRVPSSGSQAWMSSEIAHKSFDRLSGTADGAPRRRGDCVSPEVFNRIKSGLSSEPIEKVCALVDTRIAHADHSKDLGAPHLDASLADVAAAYKTLVGVRNFLSAVLLGNAFFASAVPVPQYDVSAALDEPFVGTERLPEVRKIWVEESEKRDSWGGAAELETYYPGG
jgi:hypothetical protein